MGALRGRGRGEVENEWNNVERLNKWPEGGAFAHPAGLTCGAFEQLFGTGGWEFDRQKSKKSNARGVARWGGCWGYKLIGALGTTLDQRRPMWSACIRITAVGDHRSSFHPCLFFLYLSRKFKFCPRKQRQPAALPNREPRFSNILFQFRNLTR